MEEITDEQINQYAEEIYVGNTSFTRGTMIDLNPTSKRAFVTGFKKQYRSSSRNGYQ